VARPGPLPDYSYAYWFLLTMGLALAVSNVTKPTGPGAKDPAPRWYVTALGVAALLCGLWPWPVGSGVPNAPGLRWVFEETGVPGGPPGAVPGQPRPPRAGHHRGGVPAGRGVGGGLADGNDGLLLRDDPGGGHLLPAAAKSAEPAAAADGRGVGF